LRGTPEQGRGDSTLVRATVSAFVEATDSTPRRRWPVRLWPDGPVGRLRGTVHAPPIDGDARVVIVTDGQRVELPIVVDSSRHRPVADGADLLATWVTSRGGRVVGASALSQFAAALPAELHAAPRREPWHPMRSPWWLLPFALALSVDWWLRRRRGLA
jgi:hypothetical protein